MPSSGASWRTRERIRAAPLDKEEPRIPLPRIRINKLPDDVTEAEYLPTC
jgi:hypothetical protein